MHLLLGYVAHAPLSGVPLYVRERGIMDFTLLRNDIWHSLSVMHPTSSITYIPKTLSDIVREAIFSFVTGRMVHKRPNGAQTAKWCINGQMVHKRPNGA